MNEKRDRERIVEYIVEIGMVYNAINLSNFLIIPTRKTSIIKRLIAYSSAAAGGLCLGANSASFINKVIDNVQERFAKNYNASNVEKTDSEKEVESNE